MMYSTRMSEKNEVDFKRQESGYTVKDEADSKHV